MLRLGESLRRRFRWKMKRSYCRERKYRSWEMVFRVLGIIGVEWWVEARALTDWIRLSRSDSRSVEDRSSYARRESDYPSKHKALQASQMTTQ
jgi:hypothetical protein